MALEQCGHSCSIYCHQSDRVLQKQLIAVENVNVWHPLFSHHLPKVGMGFLTLEVFHKMCVIPTETKALTVVRRTWRTRWALGSLEDVIAVVPDDVV